MSGGNRQRLVVVEVLDRRGNSEVAFAVIDDDAITLFL